MEVDYLAEARRLLAPYGDDPAPRAERIAGLYASFFLEEPFLFRWGGVATFVALQVHRALLAPRLGGRTGVLSEEMAEVLARANLDIYEHLIPDWLRFRDHRSTGRLLSPGFDLLRRADLLVRTRPEIADRAVYAALVTLSHVEQEKVVQPLLSSLSPGAQRGLTPFYLFRLGDDSGAPTCRFEGENPVDFGQRWAWTAEVVLPWAWRQLATRSEELRADANRVRRRAKLPADLLPARRGGRVGMSDTGAGPGPG